MAIRHGATTYVVDVQRERVTAGLSRRRKEERMRTLREQYGDQRFACNYSRDGFTHVLFADEEGVSLGEVVRDTFKDSPNLIWIDQSDDDTRAVVIIQAGEVAHTQVIGAGEDDSLLWASVLSDNQHEYAIVASCALPEALSGANKQITVRETSLIDDLVNSGLYLLTPADKAFTEKSTPPLAALLVVILALGLIFILFTGDSKSNEETVVDNFLGYREVLKLPSAASQLTESYRVIDRLLFLPGWHLQDCQAAGGAGLSCTLTPSQTGRVGDLRGLSEHVGREVSVELVDGNAVAHMVLAENKSVRPYAIVSTTEVRDKVRDALATLAVPDTLHVKPPEDAEFWVAQNIHITKAGTHLHALVAIAAATAHLPVNLETLQVKRSGVGFDVDVTVKIYGSRG